MGNSQPTAGLPRPMPAYKGTDPTVNRDGLNQSPTAMYIKDAAFQPISNHNHHKHGDDHQTASSVLKGKTTYPLNPYNIVCIVMTATEKNILKKKQKVTSVWTDGLRLRRQQWELPRCLSIICNNNNYNYINKEVHTHTHTQPPWTTHLWMHVCRERGSGGGGGWGVVGRVCVCVCVCVERRV